MDSLRLFCDVVRLRSFSQAAEEHAITQSAASQRISGLEKQLGTSLIDRSVRPLALTPAGEIYFREVRDLLDRYDLLEARVTRIGQPASGQVRVDAIYSAGIELLRKVEKHFNARNADVDVTVHYKRPDEVYHAVRDHQCDIGIVSYPANWRDVNLIHLRDEEMAVICNPAHPLAAVRRVHASKLDGWPLISFEPSLPVGRQIRRYLRKHGVDPEITNVFDNIDTLKNAVAVTDQIAIVPKRTAMREVLAGTLAVVDLRPRLTRPLGIIYRRRSGSAHVFTPAVQAFVDCLLEHAGPNVDLVGEMLSRRKRQMAGGRT